MVVSGVFVAFRVVIDLGVLWCLTCATFLNYTVVLVITAFDKERAAAVFLAIAVIVSFLFIRLDFLALRGVDEALDYVIIMISDRALILHGIRVIVRRPFDLFDFTIRDDLVNFSVLVANLLDVFFVGIIVIIVNYDLMSSLDVADFLHFLLRWIVTGVIA